MALGFLGSLAGGAKNLGGMFAKGARKLNEIGTDGGMPSRPQVPALGPGGTGGFAGNEGLPQAGALINRTQPQPGSLPSLRRPDAPNLEPIRDSASVNANLPAMLETPSLAGQTIPMRSTSEVRPPDLLGRKGATMDDTPLNHERYGYQTQYMQDGHVPRRWQDIAMSALHGASEGFNKTGNWAGALGGAGAGAGGAAISPIHARDFRFNQEQVPRIEASRKEYERGQDRSYELQRRGADLEGARARTAATIAGTKDAELERRYRTAQIGKMDAQAEAARLGKPVVKMITDEDTGEIYEAQIYPDGRVERRGLSGTADLRQQGYQNRRDIATDQIKSREGIADKQIGSREKIVGIQQGGANYRAGMSQSGQNMRQKERLGAQYGDAQGAAIPYGPPAPIGSVPVKRATAADVNEYARQRGISLEEARQKFTAKGYRVE